jgi:pyrimidine operon attenuation protein / uracil phosphoribosyltransferase
MTEDQKVRSVCMQADDIERAITRMAHQILEANKGAENLALVGIVTRGDVLAKRLAARIEGIEGIPVPLGRLDISFYRDDVATYFSPEVHSTHIPFNLDGMKVVLVDDVLYTGRTIRAALDALIDIGRPSCVQLAVLIDRGHRELPIRADYVGKNVPSSTAENIRLLLEETDGKSEVEILEVTPGQHVGAAPLPKSTKEGE